MVTVKGGKEEDASEAPAEPASIQVEALAQAACRATVPSAGVEDFVW